MCHLPACSDVLRIVNKVSCVPMVIKCLHCVYNHFTDRISSEDRDTVIEIEVDNRTEGDSRQLMTRSGTQFLATHEYKKNPDSAVGNELDLNEGDTVVYLMTHEENEHFGLVAQPLGSCLRPLTL